MKRFVGRSGEKAFSLLCSLEGITCNQPQEDDHGWDHIVEFPHVPAPGVPADLQRPVPAALVQTKSHEADGLSVRMKLSNALKLARSPSPCFVVLATLPPEGATPTWHAVHFWEDLITRALKRAREAMRDGIAEEEFHQHWLSFTMGPADSHDEKDLLSWMERTIREVGPDYAAAKRTLRETVGFDEARYVGNIEIGPLKSIDELVDHQLGLTPTIPMAKVVLADRRFGVDVTLPMLQGPVTFARMQANPVDQCEVRVRGPDGVEFNLTGDLILANVPGLSDEHCKARIKTWLLDIVWAFSGKSTVNGHVSTADRLSPSKIEQMARLMSWSGEGPIDVQVSVRDQRVLGAAVELDRQPDQEAYARMTALIEPLVRVSQHLRTNVPAISIEDVDQSEWVEPFYMLLNGTEMKANARISEIDALPVVDHGVAFGLAPVGDWVFGAVMRWPITNQSRADGVWCLEFGAPQILETYAFEATDAAGVEMLKADYLRYGTAPGALPLDNALLILNRASDRAA